MSMRKYARTPGPIGNRNHPANPNWLAEYNRLQQKAQKLEDDTKRYNRKRLLELGLEIIGLILFVLIMMLVVGWAN